MKTTIAWDNAQFHDCTIHEFKFVSEQWESHLILDIDYVVNITIDDQSKAKIELTRGQLFFKDIVDTQFQLFTDEMSDGPMMIYGIDKTAVNQAQQQYLNGLNRREPYYQYRVTLFDQQTHINIVATDMLFERSSQSVIVDGGRMQLYTSERENL